jgi:hypothetical protein
MKKGLMDAIVNKEEGAHGDVLRIKFIAIVLCVAAVALIAVGLFSLTGKVSLQTIYVTHVYVDSAYSDGNAGGHTFGYDAFATIQEGINAVASGGTVNVAAGTYAPANLAWDGTGFLRINKPLILEGAGSSSTVINGEHLYSVITDDDVLSTEGAVGGRESIHSTCLWIGSSGVSLKGLTVEGCDWGVRASDAHSGATTISDLTFNDVTVTDNYGHGFVFENYHGVSFSDIDFIDCNANANGDRGIYFALGTNSADVVLVNTNANNNLKAGFNCQGTIDGLTINGGTYNNNTGGLNYEGNGPYFGAGIELDGVSNVEIDGITARDNGLSGPPGIIYGDHPEEVSGGAAIIIKGASDNIEINDSDLINNANGLLIEYWSEWPGSEPTNVVVKESVILGNAYYNALNWGPEQTVSAENNWWGSAVREDIQSTISGAVDFEPWCTNAECTAFGPVMLTAVSDGTKTVYPTIQEAIDAAFAGDTVTVAAGIYSPDDLAWDGYGFLRINKPLILEGAGSSSTVINGEHLYSVITPAGNLQLATPVNGVTVGTHSTCLWIGSSGVSLKGLTVEGCDWGVRASDAHSGATTISDLAFDDVTVTYNHGHGFVFENYHGVSFSDIDFIDCNANANGDRGIYFAPNTNTMDVNLTNTNANDNWKAGFNCQGTMDGLIIEGGTFNSNTGGLNREGNGPYFGVGIELDKVSNAKINGVIAQSNGLRGPPDVSYGGHSETVSGGAAVVIKGASDNIEITNSDLTSNANGLLIEYWSEWLGSEPTNVVVKGSVIWGNTYYNALNWGPEQTVSAENNWWGSAVREDIQSTISGAVDFDVDFEPWCACEMAKGGVCVTNIPDGFYAEERENSDGSVNVTIKNEDTNNSIFMVNVPAGEIFDMTNVTVDVTEGESVKITGMNRQKVVYFMAAPSRLCVLDSDDLASLTVDDTCEDRGEFAIACPGDAMDPSDNVIVTCTLDGTTATIGPLDHSGIATSVLGVAVVSASGGGGGGSTGLMVEPAVVEPEPGRTGGGSVPTETPAAPEEAAPQLSPEEKTPPLKTLPIILVVIGIILLIGAGIALKAWYGKRKKYRF